MKKFVYVFIGMAIALGAVLLYSFKAEQPAGSKYALVLQNYENRNEVIIYYSNGDEEKASEVLHLSKIGWNRNKGFTPVENVIPMVLEYMATKGYSIVSESQHNKLSNNSGSEPSCYSYTLIKQN